MNIEINAITVPPICVLCDRLDRTISDEPVPEASSRVKIDGTEPAPLKCEAYPNGIPAAILDNRADHRKPRRGDKGLHFVGDEEEAGKLLAFGQLDEPAPEEAVI